MTKLNKYFMPLVIALTLAAGVVIGFFLHPYPNISKGEGKLIEVLKYIEDEYVDEISTDSLAELAIPDILRNLDPHSAYIPANSVEDENSKLDSSLSGIGIQFQILNDTLRVLEVVSGGPAEKVGIIPGDRIITVDGKSIIGDTYTDKQIVSMLRGDKGTHVKLGVKRQGTSKTLTYDVTRGDVPITTIDAAYLITPEIGYIKVDRFGAGTYKEFLQQAASLMIDGAEKFIIDLRGNGGGYMEPALLLANEFLEPGLKIVETKGRDQRQQSIVLSDGTGIMPDKGLVVLIDEFTASSSEIFSGAIQDNDRGIIVGRRSFGKGLVQRPITLSDNSEIRLTIQRYYTPSGRCIQKEYTPGSNTSYELEVLNRYDNGEAYNADSVKINKNLIFHTDGGRTVYGGGGIVPDIFVPNDTSAITSYFINVSNAGLIQKFAYEYCDLNRDDLNNAKNIEEMLKTLPPDNIILSSFVNYASQNGIPARWYYINISHDLIVNQIKAWIARDIFGLNGFYQIYNKSDKGVAEALKQLTTNHGNPMLLEKAKNNKKKK